MITGAPGVLRDIDDPSSRIRALDKAGAEAAIREGTVAGVVRHDLRRGRHAFATEPGGEGLGRRPRVSSHTGDVRAGEIAIEVRVPRTRNVRHAPGGLAGGGIGQRETAIEDPQAGVAHARGERVDRHQRGPSGHGHAPPAMRASRSRRLNRIAAVTPQMRCCGTRGARSNSSTWRTRPR